MGDFSVEFRKIMSKKIQRTVWCLYTFLCISDIFVLCYTVVSVSRIKPC